MNESRGVIVQRFENRLIVEVPDIDFMQSELVCDAWKIRDSLWERGVSETLFNDACDLIDRATRAAKANGFKELAGAARTLVLLCLLSAASYLGVMLWVVK